jgi:CheY-like chemotaxis protein
MDKILWVDDDESILAGYQRFLRRHYEFHFATHGYKGLEILEKEGPFAVVVSDMRMPGMDGITFLVTAREIAPDTVRMMMTGYADQQVAIDSVNQGQIFRFLNKPCPQEAVLTAIESGVRQYRLVMAEKELLEHTLRGCIQVLVDILGMTHPLAFSRSMRVKDYAVEIGRRMGMKELWLLEVAALLSQIGCVTIPNKTLERHYAGHMLQPMEEEMILGHPAIAQKLIAQIPRMDRVATILHFSTLNLAESESCGDPWMMLAARILKVTIDYDVYQVRGISPSEALRFLQMKPAIYDANVISVLRDVRLQSQHFDRKAVYVDELRMGMTIDEDVLTFDNMLVMPRGLKVNDTLRQRLKNFKMQGNIPDTVWVIMG